MSALGTWVTMVGAAAGGALAVALAMARAERRRASSAIEPFHELRGALAAIGLGLSLIERSVTSEPSPRRRLAALRSQVERAETALAELRPHPLRAFGLRDAGVPQRLDLAALVQERARHWSQLAPGYGARLRCDWRAGPAFASAAPGDLARALDNLIANALEHGGGRVLIEGERAGGCVRLTISDGGAGLDGPPATLPPPGRGHGLAIARRAIEAAGGTLSAGAAIVIELPAERHTWRPPPRVAALGRNSARLGTGARA